MFCIEILNYLKSIPSTFSKLNGKNVAVNRVISDKTEEGWVFVVSLSLNSFKLQSI